MAETSPYYLRPMLAADLPRIADIFADAFISDEVFERIWRYSPSDPRVYPDYRQWVLRTLKIGLHSKGSVNWVICRRRAPGFKNHADAAENEDDEVAAFSMWRRDGTSRTAQAWQQATDTLFCRLEEKLLTWEHDAIQAIGGYGSAYDREFSDLFDSTIEQSFEKFEPLVPEGWHLTVLAVDPRHSGRGLASMLVKWGVDRARAEMVPATLWSSPKARRLYEKHEFVVIEWPNQQRVLHDDPEDSPLMLYLPDGVSLSRRDG